VSRQGWKRLQPQLDLLALFTQQLSRYLGQAVQLHRTHAQELTEQRDWQQLETRKLVHEVNNPLSIINNYLHILGMKLGKDNPAAEEISIIKEEITRVGDILARMRDIEVPGTREEGVLHLNQVIQELFRLFEKSLLRPNGIEAELNLDESIPPLLLGAGAVKQVLMNLVKNAAEAMPEGGRLRVSTRDRVHKNGNLYVELQVCDTGPGLSDQVLTALFKPVVSSKKDHSGLGLAIVKNLLDRLSAEVSCSSTAAQGTRFQILLPRTLAENERR
ncbi:MAG: hypothetical protein JXQ81_11265, partial [Desulfuromonadales bacterium]|nr:hypothetical protein [Desulfuromonadales bacterium]